MNTDACKPSGEGADAPVVRLDGESITAPRWREPYTGVRCMCVLTKCRAGPGCPHYNSHCKTHIAHEDGA
jgi:hypothetical protein